MVRTGELTRVPLFVDEGHGGDILDAFVAGSSGHGVDGTRDAQLGIRPKAVSWGCSVLADWAGKTATGVRSIGANGRMPRDDGLRCRGVLIFFAGVGGPKCMAIGSRWTMDRRLGRTEAALSMGRHVVKPPWAIELDDETSPHGELKSGERVGVGEDGLKVGKHLGHRGMAGRRGRLRGRVPAQQEGSDVTLAEEESAPESLPGAAAEPTAGVTGGVGQTAWVVAGRQTISPNGSIRGRRRPWWLKKRTTRLMAPRRRNVSKTRARRPWTSWSGCLTTCPSGSRSNPAGRR